MYLKAFLISFSLITSVIAYGQTLPLGNNKVEYLYNGENHEYFVDPVDDTVNFKKWADNIYLGKENGIFILSKTLYSHSADTIVMIENFKDFSSFFDLKTYRLLAKTFFTNKGSVYTWWLNSDGYYPVAVPGADAATFVPFENSYGEFVNGGIDKQSVFYGDPANGYTIIKGLRSSTTKVYKLKRACEECYYFNDGIDVFFGSQQIEGADSKTFKMVYLKNIDAQDKSYKYFAGKRIK